jgi:hypothetical protein
MENDMWLIGEYDDKDYQYFEGEAAKSESFGYITLGYFKVFYKDLEKLFNTDSNEIYLVGNNNKAVFTDKSSYDLLYQEHIISNFSKKDFVNFFKSLYKRTLEKNSVSERQNEFIDVGFFIYYYTRKPYTPIFVHSLAMFKGEENYRMDSWSEKRTNDCDGFGILADVNNPLFINGERNDKIFNRRR